MKVHGYEVLLEAEKQQQEHKFFGEEELLLRDIYDWSQDQAHWIELTATHIAERLGKNVSTCKVGKALRCMGYSKGNPKYPMRIKNGLSTYRVPNKTFNSYELVAQEIKEGGNTMPDRYNELREIDRKIYYQACLIRSLESKLDRIEPFSSEFEETMDSIFKAQNEIKNHAIEKIDIKKMINEKATT